MADVDQMFWWGVKEIDLDQRREKRGKKKNRDREYHHSYRFSSVDIISFFFILLPVLLMLSVEANGAPFDHCIISTYSWHDTYSIYGCIFFVLPPDAFLCMTPPPPPFVFTPFGDGLRMPYRKCLSFSLSPVRLFCSFFAPLLLLCHSEFPLPITLYLIFTLWFLFRIKSLL